MSVPKVAATIFIGVGLGLLVYFGDQAIHAVLSSSWPTVEGVVTESKVLQRIGRRNRKTDFPAITYYYSVDGVGHTGTRLFFGSQYWASWTTGAKWTSDGKEYIARYPKGTLLQVHYDPDDAATSVVEAGLKSAMVLPVVFSIVMLGGGIVLGVVEHRRMAKLARQELAQFTLLMGQTSDEIRGMLVELIARDSGASRESIERQTPVWDHFARTGRAGNPSVRAFVEHVRATFGVFLTEEEWEAPTLEELTQTIYAKRLDADRSLEDWHRELSETQKGARFTFVFMNVLLGPLTLLAANGSWTRRVVGTIVLLLFLNTLMALSYRKAIKQLGPKPREKPLP